MTTLLTVKQVAAQLACGISTVYECIHGDLRFCAVRIGQGRKGLRVSADCLEAWIKGQHGKIDTPPVRSINPRKVA